MTVATAAIARPESFFIGGDWVAPSSDATIEVINPATETPYLRVAEATAADMERAVAAARKAFDTGPWPRMSHAERAKYLRRIADVLRARGDAFSDVWTSQMGVTRAISGAGFGTVPALFDYYAGLADSFPFVTKHAPSYGGGTGLLVQEPVGVVAAIVAWNAPAILIAVKVAPALLSGCTVIVKASPEAPGEAYLFAEIMAEIGLPAGVFNVVTADREASELLVRNHGVDKVAFTGSSAAGKKIASICGERIARYTLELGGKSAAIILDDADMGKLSAAMAGAACFLSGQVCASMTRVIVTPKRHDEVVEAIAATYRGLKVGDPMDAATNLGPLAMKRQLERVEGYIAQGTAAGARIVTGGQRPAHLNRGYFIEPTLFDGVDNDMVIARDEIFGPVTSVIRARDEAHAVELANDTVYGLNGTVFTEDLERAYSVAREVRSGTVSQNGDRADVSISFGGFKQSGIGREGGEEGLRAYLEPKLIMLDGMPAGL